MAENHILGILIGCSTAHLIMASVLALFARHKVQYLALSWILGIFAAAMFIQLPFHAYINGAPGIMHPMMLLSITGAVFLQSIYPLSIPMPAYLQMGRMWKYALPAIVLFSIYGISLLCGLHPLRLNTWEDIAENWYNLDIWMRLAAFVLAGYYIVNILRLPSKLASRSEIPMYMKVYCVALSASVIFFFTMNVWYSPAMMMAYIVICTLLNMYISFRTLETMAIHLPKPAIVTVEMTPEKNEQKETDNEDFNETNLNNFKRVEFWMQNNRSEWSQSTFNRNILCEQVGLNRHLLLQCLRSQGYNDTHEYINTYRYEELKRLIQRGAVRTANEACDAGFGTVKTARTVFMNLSNGESLDEFLARYKDRE